MKKHYPDDPTMRLSPEKNLHSAGFDEIMP